MQPLAISSGDPAGIGLEIIFKAWQMRKQLDLPQFFVLADPHVITRWLDHFGWDIPFVLTTEKAPAAFFEEKLPVLPLKNQQRGIPGSPSTIDAAGIIEAIEGAVYLVNKGTASAVVTCPIAKKYLYDAGFNFPGHTEFLADLAEKATGKTVKPVMMLAGPELRTIPVTIHIALKDVPRKVTKELIIETAEIAAADFKAKFDIPLPRLAIAGLNPHAGEDGSMGHEDNDIVRPAIEILQKKGIDACGPFPSDTLFHAQARKKYDVALCMYHDQALIPVKTIGFDNTVNVTLGLPFIRTSPDHGTAFDIAGKGIASPESLIAAINMAAELANNMQKS